MNVYALLMSVNVVAHAVYMTAKNALYAMDASVFVDVIIAFLAESPTMKSAMIVANAVIAANAN
jgi:hypothetical protein